MIKTWEKLAEEVNKDGLTSLICCQGFEATKQDSMEDNNWQDSDETSWKQDTMFRMLDENLDYGEYNETEEEVEAADDRHSALMGLRCNIAGWAASAWITGEVNNLKEAQAFANKLIKKVKVEDYMPK